MKNFSTLISEVKNLSFYCIDSQVELEICYANNQQRSDVKHFNSYLGIQLRREKILRKHVYCANVKMTNINDVLASRLPVTRINDGRFNDKLILAFAYEQVAMTRNNCLRTSEGKRRDWVLRRKPLQFNTIMQLFRFAWLDG